MRPRLFCGGSTSAIVAVSRISGSDILRATSKCSQVEWTEEVRHVQRSCGENSHMHMHRALRYGKQIPQPTHSTLAVLYSSAQIHGTSTAYQATGTPTYCTLTVLYYTAARTCTLQRPHIMQVCNRSTHWSTHEHGRRD